MDRVCRHLLQQALSSLIGQVAPSPEHRSRTWYGRVISLTKVEVGLPTDTGNFIDFAVDTYRA